MGKAEDMIKEGYKHYCLNCKRAYKEVPQKWHDDVSCMGAYLDECPRCGCDLFDTFENYLKRCEESPEEKEEDNELSRVDLLDMEDI